MQTGRVRRSDPLLSPSGQKGRLTFLVVVLAFMLFSIHWASQGQHWTWLVPSSSSSLSPDSVPVLREIELKPKVR